MKKLRLILAVLFLLLVGTFIISNVSTITGHAPMIAFHVYISKNGTPVSPEAISSFQFIFSEEDTSKLTNTPSRPLKDATWVYEFFLVQAPFTVMHGNLFSKESIKPSYRSILLKIIFKNGETFTFRYPIISDTRLNSPIYIDISEQKKNG